MTVIVKIGSNYYRQSVGIPQGSVLSTILCSFFYGDLEKSFTAFSEHSGSVSVIEMTSFTMSKLVYISGVIQADWRLHVHHNKPSQGKRILRHDDQRFGFYLTPSSAGLFTRYSQDTPNMAVSFPKKKHWQISIMTLRSWMLLVRLTLVSQGELPVTLLSWSNRLPLVWPTDKYEGPLSNYRLFPVFWWQYET